LKPRLIFSRINKIRALTRSLIRDQRGNLRKKETIHEPGGSNL